VICRHCHQAKVGRPRGLCWCCYYAPGVRERYPSTSKFARRGIADLTGERRQPIPTEALPGTPEKVAVMCARAARGQSLFHDDDATVVNGMVVGPLLVAAA
jgi:hypothetical protein